MPCFANIDRLSPRDYTRHINVGVICPAFLQLRKVRLVKRFYSSLAIGLMLTLVGAARADLCIPGAAAGVDLSPSVIACEQPARTDLRTEQVESSVVVVDPIDELPLGPGALADYSSGTLADSSGRTNVEELPGLPGSASLFLSAALSVGAWHLVRKSRDIHLGHLPDWYHPDAPAQIGHSVAVDLQFAPMAVCIFDQPFTERPFIFRVPRVIVSRCESQHFLHIEAPRGPPV